MLGWPSVRPSWPDTRRARPLGEGGRETLACAEVLRLNCQRSSPHTSPRRTGTRAGGQGGGSSGTHYCPEGAPHMRTGGAKALAVHVSHGVGEGDVEHQVVVMSVGSVRYTPYEGLLGGGHVHELCGGQAALVVLVALHALVQVHSLMVCLHVPRFLGQPPRVGPMDPMVLHQMRCLDHSQLLNVAGALRPGGQIALEPQCVA
mmetsp:Transcript_29839/g.67706  ORF Transcript_29839/g.67706 Transcript_29839/m.67706 type:complete len:203 (-) Transcript_29839:687-1295(-)